MNYSSICGIDPGSTNGAACVVSKKKVSFTAIGEYLENYVSEIDKLIKEFNVKTICLEQIVPYTYQRGGAGMMARIAPLLINYGECRYFIIRNEGREDFTAYEPTAAVWKKYFKFKRFQTEERMSALAKRGIYEALCVGLKLHPEYISSVEVLDSFFIACYGIDKHNATTTCKEIIDNYYEKTYSKESRGKAKTQSGKKKGTRGSAVGSNRRFRLHLEGDDSGNPAH